MASELFHLSQDYVMGIQEARTMSELALDGSMNEISDAIIEAGGSCDEEAFLAAFYCQMSNHVSFAANNIPKREQDVLAAADVLQYAAHEPWMEGTTERDSLVTDWIGIILPSPAQNPESPVLDFEVKRSVLGDAYAGAISFNGFYTSAREIGRDAEIKPIRKEVVAFERQKGFASYPKIEHSERTLDITISMPSIRKAVAVKRRSVADHKAQALDYHYERLREYVANLDGGEV